MNLSLFEDLVKEALDSLPPEFQEKLSNVSIVVEDFPPQDILREKNLHSPYSLLGLYVGVPQNRRGMGYSFILPDRILIFKKPIEARASTPEEIRALVKEVVLHEIGHHFGLSEEELRRAAGDD